MDIEKTDAGRSQRHRDEYGRAFYRDGEVPPATERFAHWRGRLTHPDAVVTNRTDHRCVGGWVLSGEWWLHCGVCRPATANARSQS